MRLIDAVALYKDICDGIEEMTDIGIPIDAGWLWVKLNNALDNAPTIEPERRKGKWNHGLCSVCGYDWGKDAPIANVPSFCPNCGARMEEGEK